jgi:thymidylate kinase
MVAELVGVAAAGKSSLLRALGERCPTLRAGVRPSRSRHLAYVLPLVPTFVGLHRPFRGVLWREMKRIAYLRTLDRMLEGPAVRRHPAVVLDEGPVYMLARLRVYGGERIRSAAFERWWQREVEHWARRVDLVVWLDAPDPVLLGRLRARPQFHRVERRSDADAGRFFASYRRAYESVVGGLAGGSGPRVVRARSDRESIEQLVHRVVTELRLHRELDR